MRIIQFVEPPENSIIGRCSALRIHYSDSFMASLPLDKGCSVDRVIDLLFSSPPGWVNLLFTIRNMVVKPFGLKTGYGKSRSEEPLPLGSAPPKRYTPGERAALFKVVERSDSEIVVEENDRHLFFRASLLIRESRRAGYRSVYFTTLVHFHNIWGRIYFLFVKPLHKFLIKRLLLRLSTLPEVSEISTGEDILHDY